MTIRPISRIAARLSTLTPKPAIAALPPQRLFSTTKPDKAQNRIYTPVRRPEEFQTYLALATSSRTPLLTFWTASYCSTCKAVGPLLQELISEHGVGEAEGGIAYCEVEFDSPDIMSSDLATTFAITSMPTLLAFHKGFAEHESKVTKVDVLGNRERLEEWIREEARKRDTGGNGGGWFGLFGGR